MDSASLPKDISSQDLLAQLALAQKILDNVAKKVSRLLPQKYGSDKWWEKEIEEGIKEIKAGKSYTFDSVAELSEHLGV